MPTALTAAWKAASAAIAVGGTALSKRRRKRARRSALSQLRASEQRFHLLVDAVRDYAIFMLDADGNVSTWNTGAERIKGYSAAEIIGRPYATFFTPEDVAEGKPARVLAAARDLGRYEEEGFRLRRDGSRFWSNVVLTAVRDEQGRLVGYAKVTRDFTERRKSEQALRELATRLAQSVRERNAVIEELEGFSYSVSHDLRAPLRWVDGFSQALLEDHGAQLDADAVSRVHSIREAVARMGQLIDDLLRLSRVTRADLDRCDVDLSAIARGVFESLRGAEPGRAVEVQIADGVHGQADPRLIRQVLANLFDNALKFSRGREPARIEFGVREGEDGRVYHVRDNGVGFDLAHAHKLFRPFERLHSASEFPGTGIGLAIARRIVQRHGGVIWAESEPGAGAAFYFTLGERTDGEPA